MSEFDPTSYEDRQGQRSDKVTPGWKVMALIDFERNSGDKGDYLSCTLAVLESEPNKPDESGLRVWDNMSLSEQALWRLANFCRAVGQTEKFDIDDDDAIDPALMDKPFKARISLEKSNRQGYDPRPRIAEFHALSAARQTDEWRKKYADKIKEIVERLKAHEGSSGGGGGGGGGASQGSGASDGDIPF